MKHYVFQRAYIPKTRAEKISDTVEFPPKQFNMPNMSSKDATFNTVQDLIYALQNPAPARPLVKPKDGHKEELRTLEEIFRKPIPPEVPLRVSVREGFQEKLKEVNQERSQMKSASQSKPFTNE